MPRHLAIGDIHGCYDALRALCDIVQLTAGDVLITLGDYVNRGPNTNAVLDWLIHLRKTHTLRPLRGNHDIMMQTARDNPREYRKWLDAGGDATLRSYGPFEGEAGRIDDIPEAHWRFLEELLPYHETDTHFFVHASACPDIPLAEQPDFMRYWEPWNDPPPHESGKILVCGHTSQKSGLPLSNGHAICIDTWACGTGWLSCLHVESGMIWQANQAGDTRQLNLADLPIER
jgi:serine/threonine protein phosphatase 1